VNAAVMSVPVNDLECYDLFKIRACVCPVYRLGVILCDELNNFL